MLSRGIRACKLLIAVCSRMVTAFSSSNTALHILFVTSCYLVSCLPFSIDYCNLGKQLLFYHTEIHPASFLLFLKVFKIILNSCSEPPQYCLFCVVKNSLRISLFCHPGNQWTYWLVLHFSNRRMHYVYCLRLLIFQLFYPRLLPYLAYVRLWCTTSWLPTQPSLLQKGSWADLTVSLFVFLLLLVWLRF